MTTKIAWTNTTLNPIVGCSKCSPGCYNCYAERMAVRQKAMAKARGVNPVDDKYYSTVVDGRWTGHIGYDKRVMKQALHWKTPRKVFVGSMTDMFHENVPLEWLDKVIDMIALCEAGLCKNDTTQHFFQILTKRGKRMAKYFSDRYGEEPLPKNLWLGVTAENQAMADKRIVKLREIPAAVRFVSVEPMLELVNIKFYGPDIECGHCQWQGYNENDTPNGGLKKMYKGEDGWNRWGEVDDPDDEGWWVCPGCGISESEMKDIHLGKIDWVIIGAETGPGARPMKIEWAEKLVSDCRDAGVPCFVKALPVNGKVTDKMKLWPKELRVRQWPEAKAI